MHYSKTWSSWIGFYFGGSLLTFVLCFYRFYVDGRPIREFKNLEGFGIPYPKNQPMRVYSSLWNADDWATRGGLVKTNWTQAPFTASFRKFNANACVWSNGASSCSNSNATNNTWLSQELNSTGQKRLKWVQTNYMVYSYCMDTKRFPQGLPRECNVTNKAWSMDTNHSRPWIIYTLKSFSLHRRNILCAILIVEMDNFHSVIK